MRVRLVLKAFDRERKKHWFNPDPINFFQVYVLDENKQLVVVLGAKPMDVQREMDSIVRHLSNVTGFDVRVRRLEANAKAAMDAYVIFYTNDN